MKANVGFHAVKYGDLASPAKNSLGAMRTGRWLYDFAAKGGAVGTIALEGEALPTNAVIVDGIMHVKTAITGGALATAALQTEAANDTVVAAVVTGAPWSTTGLKDVVPVGTAATSIRTTVGTRIPSLVVGVAALTAGKFVLFLRFYVSE